jgi:hypothetical protein
LKRVIMLGRGGGKEDEGGLEGEEIEGGERGWINIC